MLGLVWDLKGRLGPLPSKDSFFLISKIYARTSF